MATAALTVH